MDLTWLVALIAFLAAPVPAAPVTPDELPVGPPPRVAYGFAEHPTFQGGDWRLLRPDGSSQRLPHWPGALVVRDDHVVNGYGTEGGFEVEVVSRAGRVVRRAHGLCAFGLVTNADHSLAGWLDGRTLVTVDQHGRLRRQQVGLPSVECSDLAPAALDRARVYTAGYRHRGPFVLRHGRPPARLTALRTVTDVTRHLALGLRPDPSHCSAAVTLRGVRRWQTCDHRLLDAAPDGRHVLGILGSGVNPRAVSVFSRDGRLVTEWSRPPGAWVDAVGWEDDGHVLLVLQDDRGWSIVRLRMDGSAEYAVAPLPIDSDCAPFRIPLS